MDMDIDMDMEGHVGSSTDFFALDLLMSCPPRSSRVSQSLLSSLGGGGGEGGEGGGGTAR